MITNLEATFCGALYQSGDKSPHSKEAPCNQPQLLRRLPERLHNQTMRKLCSSFAFILLLSTLAFATTETMRLDYYHSGNSAREIFSADRVVIEPLPWPGDLSQAIDKSNLGKYFFEVRDQKTKQVFYSRGFASIYGEWETTDEAKTANRTFQESLRFPAPTSPVDIVLKKRDAKNVFQEIWTTQIDPADQFVDRTKLVAPAPVITIHKMGDPEKMVDFLILGDGYTAAEAKKFEADARRLTGVLFSTSPFMENRRRFNVWALCPQQLSQVFPDRRQDSIATTRSAPLTMHLVQNDMS
jgi:hypothetical protein